MPDVFPPWKETREKLLNAGIDDKKIEEGLQKMKARSGGTVDDLNALYYMAAKVIFKVEVPKVSSLRSGGGGRDAPGQRVTCGDLSVNTIREAEANGTRFEIAAYVYNGRQGLTRNQKPQFTLTLLDHTGSIFTKAYSGKDGGAYQKLTDLQLKDGDFVFIDHLQAETRDWDGGGDPKRAKTFIDFKIPPWAEIKRVPVPEGYGLEACFRDANTQLVSDGGLAYVRGFVTEDDRGDMKNGAQGWLACTASNKKVDKDTQMCEVDHEGPCVPVEKTFRKLSVSPGGKLFTVAFGPEKHPKEPNLEGEAITAFCRYDKNYNTYECLWYEKGAERELKTGSDILSYSEEQPAEAPTPSPATKKKAMYQKTPEPTAQPAGGPVAERRLQITAPKIPPVPPKPKQAKWTDELDNLKKVHDLIMSMDDGKGAPWEDVMPKVAEQYGVPEDVAEEAFNALMDMGDVYEPVLGRLKSTRDSYWFPELAETEEEDEDQEVTTADVVAELNVPTEGMRLNEIKARLKECGYEEDTLEALLEDKVLEKRGMRYVDPSKAAPAAPVAPTTPTAPAKAAPATRKAAPAPAPTPKAPKASGASAGSLPPAAVQVLTTFLKNFKQNPKRAVVRKLQEKVPDHDPEDLLTQAEAAGLITTDKEVAKQHGINNPSGDENNPFLYWVGA